MTPPPSQDEGTSPSECRAVRGTLRSYSALTCPLRPRHRGGRGRGPALCAGKVRWVIFVHPRNASVTPTTSPSHASHGPHPLPRKRGGEGARRIARARIPESDD